MKSKLEQLAWPRWIAVGIAFQAMAFAVVEISWLKNNDVGENAHNLTGATVGVLIFWVGFWVMVVGVIALAVRVGQEISGPAFGSGRRAGAPPPNVSGDPILFDPHPGDSDLVADVRRELRLGTSRSDIRKLVGKTAREHRLDKNDHAYVEALLDERDRRRADVDS